MARKGFAGDKFAAFRDPATVNIVGIAMDLEYVVETRPQAFGTDHPGRDAHDNVRYLYDVELDGAGNVIGGEWYQNTHPDFLWTPPRGTRAVAPTDRLVARAIADGEGWAASDRSKLPSKWADAAVQSARGGTPLGNIVETLINASRI